jgi:hypothetical protein
MIGEYKYFGVFTQRELEAATQAELRKAIDAAIARYWAARVDLLVP